MFCFFFKSKFIYYLSSIFNDSIYLNRFYFIFAFVSIFILKCDYLKK